MFRIAGWLFAAGVSAWVAFAPGAFAEDAGESAFGARCVALTFDDGPDPVLTPKLLDILAAQNVKASFYVVGRRVATWPGIVQRAFQEGHEIGNHTWDHPQLPSLSSREVEAEFSRTDAAIKAATGVAPATIRAPYGAQSARIAEIAAPRPLVLWDTDTLDWLHQDREYVTRVADRSPVGKIVLMHDIHRPTIAAVPGIIRDLKARGISFVTISEFLAGRCGRGTSVAFRRSVTPTVAAVAGGKTLASSSPSTTLPSTRSEGWCRKLGLFNPSSGMVTEGNGASWQCVPPKVLTALAAPRSGSRPEPVPGAAKGRTRGSE
jgi:peptidoglycan/xylan/chitin deacetylase (PgdA/CDA1 family)